MNSRLLSIRLCVGVFIRMCYKLVVVVLGLILCCSYSVQAEDVTFDPDNIG